VRTSYSHKRIRRQLGLTE